VAWAILNLCRHPEKLKKLQEEVDRVLGNEQVEFIPTDELNELKYTQNCLKESLRLVSVAPGTARTTGDTERQVGPYLLPPNVSIHLSLYEYMLMKFEQRTRTDSTYCVVG
jgi:cytochrome P450